MTANFTHLAPLEPGQPVAIFRRHEVSGAFIADVGIVYCVEGESIYANPACPDRWQYWIEVDGDLIPAEGSQILPRGPAAAEDENISGLVLLQIRFAVPPSDDNEALMGSYRLGNVAWGYFVFRKDPCPNPTYQLRQGATDDIPSMLICEVPLDWRLDERFVKTAFESILGADVPPEER